MSAPSLPTPPCRSIEARRCPSSFLGVKSQSVRPRSFDGGRVGAAGAEGGGGDSARRGPRLRGAAAGTGTSSAGTGGGRGSTLPRGRCRCAAPTDFPPRGVGADLSICDRLAHLAHPQPAGVETGDAGVVRSAPLRGTAANLPLTRLCPLPRSPAGPGRDGGRCRPGQGSVPSLPA